MDPHKVAVLPDDLCEALGEDHVGADVRLPEIRVEPAQGVRRHGQHVVQKRPQLLLAEALIEASSELGL